MKKLLFVFVFMSIVTVANAQSSIVEKDFILEQVISSISSLKQSQEKNQLATFIYVGLSQIDNNLLNSYQYILKPADKISIASTYFEASDKISAILEKSECHYEVAFDTTSELIPVLSKNRSYFLINDHQ